LFGLILIFNADGYPATIAAKLYKRKTVIACESQAEQAKQFFFFVSVLKRLIDTSPMN